MSGMVQSLCVDDVRTYYVYLEEPAVTWICGQVAAYITEHLERCFPVPDLYWEVLKVRKMGDRDSYHRLFGNSYPESYEVRLIVFSNCGNSHYRLDAVSFNADHIGAQIEIVPIVSYIGAALPA